MKEQEQKTYRLLTKNRTLREVPREGNHLAAVQQGVGYGVGYSFGVVSALVIEPLVGMVKDTNLWRGGERGFVEAHRRVDVAKASRTNLRANTREELEFEGARRGLARDQMSTMNDLQLSREVAERTVPTAYVMEGFFKQLEDREPAKQSQKPARAPKQKPVAVETF